VQIRPHGTIKVWGEGHAFFPENIRDELGVKKDVRVPYYIDSKTVLLVKQGVTTKELLDELDALKIIVARRGEYQDELGSKKRRR